MKSFQKKRKRNRYPKVVIIIPTYNGEKYIYKCLETISKQSYKNFEVFIVDDVSEDNTVSICRNFRVKIIVNGHRQGFAKSINHIIKLPCTKADFYVFLNQDTVADKKWLVEMVQASEKHSSAMVAPNIVDYSLYPCRIEFGAPIIFLDKFGALLYGEPTNEIIKTNTVPGTGCLIRASLFEKIGLLDERLFMYWEDIDLSIRAVQAGETCIYNPHSTLYHRTHNPSLEALRLVVRNIHIILVKHFGLKGWLSALPWILIQHFHLCCHYKRDYALPISKGSFIIARAWIEGIWNIPRFVTNSFCESFRNYTVNILRNTFGQEITAFEFFKYLRYRIILKG